MPEAPNHSERKNPPEGTTPSRPTESASEDRVAGVTGIVLAGGKSRRYGKNKALERIDGVPLIERAVRTLERVFHHVLLSTNTPKDFDFLDLPFVKDRITGLGPLGGVHAGLIAMPDEAGFFVACDMPLLNPALIRHMALSGGDSDAVVPRIGGYLEPLHALYRRACLAPVNRAIERGDRGIRSFYSEIRIRYMEEADIRVFEPDLDAFVNVNRPGELRLSLSRLHRHRP